PAVPVATREQAPRGRRDASQGDLPRAADPGMNEAGLNTIADDLLRPLERTSWRFYTLVLVLGSLVAMGAGAFMYQAYMGIGVWGIRIPIYWAFDITNFIFWIGISHAGTLISAILRLVDAQWRRPVS